jgi:hypothetical protein
MTAQIINKQLLSTDANVYVLNGKSYVISEIPVTCSGPRGREDAVAYINNLVKDNIEKFEVIVVVDRYVYEAFDTHPEHGVILFAVIGFNSGVKTDILTAPVNVPPNSVYPDDHEHPVVNLKGSQ